MNCGVSALSKLSPYLSGSAAQTRSERSVLTSPGQSETTLTPAGLKSWAMSKLILSVPALPAP